jgi:hypothetical protein
MLHHKTCRFGLHAPQVLIRLMKNKYIAFHVMTYFLPTLSEKLIFISLQKYLQRPMLLECHT